jgi:hypothetical protein
MSVYVTGDTHGDMDIRKLFPQNWKEGKELTKNDYLIIAGDFGLIWDVNESGALERQNLAWLSSKPWTTLFVDGNHENFDRINALPTKEMFGEKVGIVSDSIFHLMRGRIYNIDFNKIFVMGGAYSIDKIYRTEKISWWAEEVPSYQERSFALQMLELHNNKVDYIITHTGPSSILGIKAAMYGKLDEYTDFLAEYVNKVVDFKHWYFGHFHENARYGEKHTCLYNEIVKIF